MARRNRHKKKKTKAPVPSGNERARLVLEIVRTDSTFELFTFHDGDQAWVGKCIHCNRRLTVKPNGETSFTIEHIVPRTAGGDNDPRNLALACGECNNEKGWRHDSYVGRNDRADEIVSNLQGKRSTRWREEPS